MPSDVTVGELLWKETCEMVVDNKRTIELIHSFIFHAAGTTPHCIFLADGTMGPLTF